MPNSDLLSQRIPKYLTQEEARSLFRAIECHRDQALFALVYLYGLRVGEVGLLTCGDVDLGGGRIVIKRLKGGVWAERPLFSSARDLLLAHLATLRDAGPTSPLFPGKAGALRKRRIQALFIRYRKLAGISDRFTCHCLRHSIATHLLDAGLPIEFVQDHLGHRDVRSTTIYSRVSDRHRAAVFRALETSPWIVQPTRPVDRQSADG